MTLRIPKWLMFALAALVLMGAGMAGTRLVVNQSSAGDGDTDRPQPRAEDAAADARKCERQAGDFLMELARLESRLALGVGYADYLERVGDARVAYARVPVNDLDVGCLQVAAPAENVLKTHVEAVEVWTKCVGERGCKNESIRPKLRRKWQEASSQLEESRQAMRALKQ